MSALIDCVFLLLIFFLVTTTLKHHEKHLPLSLPDGSARVAQQANETSLSLGLNEKGEVFRVLKDKYKGAHQYEALADLGTYLAAIEDPKTPLRIECDRFTPFQRALAVLDVCKARGFTNIALKVKGE